MADLKISQLTSASTPLSGTETLPVVQSGATKKATVLDLTNGLTISPSSVTGVATNSDAPAGAYGEFISASATYGAYTSGFVSIASVSLTAGDWDVDCSASLNQAIGQSLFDYIQFGVSTSDTTLVGYSSNLTENFVPASGAAYYIDYRKSPVTQRITLAATTTVYLVFRAGFTGGTLLLNGLIRARRVR